MEDIMSDFISVKGNSFPRFIMISSIPVILFVCLLMGFNNIISLKVEIHSILIIFLILLIFLFFIPHNAWYSYSLLKKKINGSKNKFEEFITSKEVTIQNTTKSYASLDDYFSNFTKNLRNDNFANIATSLFPTLGILGTFSAIAISMPNFTVDSKQALENEITLLLSGVGTAFYASIYGIFLSIWWTFFEKRGLTKIENEINLIKSSNKHRLWSKDEIDMMLLLETQRDKFADKIEKLLTPDYLFKLDEIVKSKLEYLERINKAFVIIENKVSKNYEHLSSTLEGTTLKQDELLKNFEEIQKNIKEINASFDKSLKNQNANQKAIKSETYSVLSSLELVASDLKELGKELVNGK
ncbi:hypothetical protein CRV07_14110 [Halarcobacter ebronensis]|uniref:MotA/TolQ/ExbB proton channel domain-containing protein n=2 Tax=Halarcobacter ebronensis TaxID=1462615 RepID=A0A4V1LZT8_9BACT|nr:hypothetical protein CRV07_14110 [Halarcobacter ebronensis]